MASGIENLPIEGQSLDLTPSLRAGLRAITILAFISFFTTSTLFLYLGYKLVYHAYIKPARTASNIHHQQQGEEPKSFQQSVDFALGIDGIFTERSHDKEPERGRRGSKHHTTTTTLTSPSSPTATTTTPPPRRQRSPPNQFLLLIFNLLLADMHQGVAFFLNAVWLQHDQVRVGTATCFAQGLFISTGDLASSCFITTIAVHTYLSVVRRYRPSHRTLYCAIAAVWLFVYLISTLPIAATRNGLSSGGFFVRAGSWCWMNNEYSELRLLTHYLFIFIAIATTSGLYIAIFINLRKNTALGADMANIAPDSATADQLQLSHNPAFLIYPVIYVICTLPLALGRIASMTGADVPLGYMSFAGAMIASNGSFDCLLFGTTRNVIIFASKHEVDKSDTGISTFNFMQTPRTRTYGNMIWVQGGSGGRGGGGGGSSGGRRGSNVRHRHGEDKIAGGWWSWQRLGGEANDVSGRVLGHRRTGSRSVSQESLRGPGAIQMDTVTSVVVEVDHGRERDPRYPDPAASTSSSVNSAEKDYSRAL